MTKSFVKDHDKDRSSRNGASLGCKVVCFSLDYSSKSNDISPSSGKPLEILSLRGADVNLNVNVRLAEYTPIERSVRRYMRKQNERVVKVRECQIKKRCFRQCDKSGENEVLPVSRLA